MKINLFEILFPAFYNLFELEKMATEEINRIKINNFKLSQDKKEYNKVKQKLYEKVQIN